MSCGLPVPGPAEDFTLRTVSRQEVGIWYHVYSRRDHPDNNAHTFAEGWGDTRFAPITQADGQPVPSCYLASTPEAAYMESLLHDVPCAPPGLFEVDALRHHHLVQLQLPPALQCVSFHSLDLPRLHKLDRLPACYPETRAWAQAAYLQCATAQAIAYGSRRNDAARCLMLFRQRMPDPPFQVLREEPLAIGARRTEVLALVRSLKLHEV